MARFDRMARWYERANPYRDGAALREGLRSAPHHIVLDIGGGTGQVADVLAGSYHRYVVLDPSGGMLHQARRRRGGVETLRGLGERLPFADASVDRVIMVDALHHVGDQDLCLAEIARVLRPGGRVVVQEFRMDRWWKRVGLVGVERLARFKSRFDREKGWKRRFEAAGLHVVGVRPVSWSDVQFVLSR